MGSVIVDWISVMLVLCLKINGCFWSGGWIKWLEKSEKSVRFVLLLRKSHIWRSPVWRQLHVVLCMPSWSMCIHRGTCLRSSGRWKNEAKSRHSGCLFISLQPWSGLDEFVTARPVDLPPPTLCFCTCREGGFTHYHLHLNRLPPALTQILSQTQSRKH